MPDTPMVHPVTGAFTVVAAKDVKQYEQGGWVDNTPYEPKVPAKSKSDSDDKG